VITVSAVVKDGMGAGVGEETIESSPALMTVGSLSVLGSREGVDCGDDSGVGAGEGEGAEDGEGESLDEIVHDGDPIRPAGPVHQIEIGRKESLKGGGARFHCSCPDDPPPLRSPFGLRGRGILADSSIPHRVTW